MNVVAPRGREHLVRTLGLPGSDLVDERQADLT